jgi:hypothetical protein
MIAFLIFMVGVVMLTVLAVLAVVVAGIRREPPGEELTSQPPSGIATWVRHLLGVHVRRPPPLSHGPLVPPSSAAPAVPPVPRVRKAAVRTPKWM